MQNEALDMVVVDDNPILVSVLSEIFRECGHTVRVAANGFCALAEIKNRVPDLVLSDLNMPGMSGYELLSVIRRKLPSIRVIAMSGAYSGGCVPPGIAADAFYAKGESSVAQLVDLVSAVWRDAALKVAQSKSTCPHCMTHIEVALVSESRGTDGTPIAIAASKRERDDVHSKSGRANGEPTGRMHQQ